MRRALEKDKTGEECKWQREEESNDDWQGAAGRGSAVCVAAWGI